MVHPAATIEVVGGVHKRVRIYPSEVRTEQRGWNPDLEMRMLVRTCSAVVAGRAGELRGRESSSWGEKSRILYLMLLVQF